jgi:hypothetical protein
MLLNSTCVVVPVHTASTSGYGVFLCIPKEGAKMQQCNACTSYSSNINIQRNTIIDHKVYSMISKVNLIYQVIWLMWILKLSGSNSNNKWNRVDHDAIFTCLLQLSCHKVKHGPKEHHLMISNSQHQNNHTHETINKYNDPTLPPEDRQKQSTPTNSSSAATSHFYNFNSRIAMISNKCSTNILVEQSTTFVFKR